MGKVVRFLVIGSGVIVLAVLGVAFWLDRQFEDPNADYVPSLVAHLGVSSVLAVLAHPDDEIVIAGLLSDATSRPGVKVKTLTFTRGEAGMGPDPICSPEHLGVVRTAELYKYGFFLDLDEQEVLDYPDGALEEQPLETLVNEIIARVQRWKPDLVVTFDPSTGLTLHRDHMTVGTATTRALSVAIDSVTGRASGTVHAPILLAYVVTPKRVLVRFGGEVGREIARKQPSPNFAVPAHRRVKTKGWEIHETQRHVIREIFGVPPWFLYRFYDKEYYSLLKP